MKITEIELRISLAKYLIAQEQDNTRIFASEARYGFGDRRADFVMINSFSHAFEIKSDFDTTARLSEQLTEYVSTFDYVTVVTTPNHLKKIREMSTKKVGLIIQLNGGIKLIRTASLNKRLSKHHLVSSITKERLINYLPNIKKSSALETVRNQAIKQLKTVELRKLFIDELHSRFFASSEQFFLETDSEINEEDLMLLKRASHLWF